MKRTAVILVLTGLVVMGIAVVVLCAGPLFSPATPDSPSEPDSTSTPTDTAPSVADIEIIEWHLDEIYGTTYVVGELRNNSSIAVGVQLQAVVRDHQGRVIDSAQWWPASTNNIPSGATWPISFGVSDKESIGVVELSVVRVKVWE